MSLRIRLPPLKPSSTTAAEPMEYAEQPKRNRKRPKRYEDGDHETAALESERKVARSSASEKPRWQSTAEGVPSPAPAADPDIDVVNDVNIEDPELGHDHHSEHSAHRMAASTSTSQSKPAKAKTKAHGDGPPARKKTRKVVVSESEEDDYMDTAPDVVPEPDDNDDDSHSPDEEPPKVSKGKGKATANTGRKGVKRKAKVDPSDVRPALQRKGYVDAPAAGKKRARPSFKPDDALIDVVSIPEASTPAEQSSPATMKHNSPAPAPPPPKKPKLPTIKKTKLAGSTGLNTPTSATGTLKANPSLELGVNKLNIDRKMPMGNTDVDLSNKSIYEELFKTGQDGGTPRTGLNRRTKEEERRKELNRLRDEAKARRATEALHSFDLQSQFDKISRFEEELRARKSSALYPNFMAAKWREQFEKEKRQKEQEWSKSVHTNGRDEDEGEPGEVK